MPIDNNISLRRNGYIDRLEKPREDTGELSIKDLMSNVNDRICIWLILLCSFAI